MNSLIARTRARVIASVDERAMAEASAERGRSRIANEPLNEPPPPALDAHGGVWQRQCG